MEKQAQEIELASGYIMLEIPEEAFSLTIHAKVFIDGEVEEVSRSLTAKDIREAMNEYDLMLDCARDGGYIHPDDTFVLASPDLIK